MRKEESTAFLLRDLMNEAGLIQYPNDDVLKQVEAIENRVIVSRSVWIWSTEKPTVQGWYWYRKNEQEQSRIVNVYSSFGEPFTVTFTGNDRVFELASLSGQWAGPIPMPK